MMKPRLHQSMIRSLPSVGTLFILIATTGCEGYSEPSSAADDDDGDAEVEASSSGEGPQDIPELEFAGLDPFFKPGGYLETSEFPDLPDSTIETDGDDLNGLTIGVDPVNSSDYPAVTFYTSSDLTGAQHTVHLQRDDYWARADLPADFQNNVRGYNLKPRCRLKIYSETGQKGHMHDGYSVNQNLAVSGIPSFRSFAIFCDNSGGPNLVVFNDIDQRGNHYYVWNNLALSDSVAGQIFTSQGFWSSSHLSSDGRVGVKVSRKQGGRVVPLDVLFEDRDVAASIIFNKVQYFDSFRNGSSPASCDSVDTCWDNRCGGENPNPELDMPACYIRSNTSWYCTDARTCVNVSWGSGYIN